MRLYLDTADPRDWARLMPSGAFWGITTNPTLAQRAGLDYAAIDWTALARRAADLGARELHGQIAGDAAQALRLAADLKEAGVQAGIATVVKIPLTAARRDLVVPIRALGVPILMTACYNAAQMALSQALGAAYVAPYYGRMVDALGPDEARARMAQIAAIAARGGCRPLVASVREVGQVVALAGLGLDCFTLAPPIAQALWADPLTDAAAEVFEQAARVGCGDGLA
jgi:transaldolase